MASACEIKVMILSTRKIQSLYTILEFVCYHSSAESVETLESTTFCLSKCFRLQILAKLSKFTGLNLTTLHARYDIKSLLISTAIRLVSAEDGGRLRQSLVFVLQLSILCSEISYFVLDHC